MHFIRPMSRPSVFVCNQTSVTHAKARPMRLPTSLLTCTRAGFTFLFGLLAGSVSLPAQQGTGTVRGTVTQTGNNEPLAGVIVTVGGTTIKAVSNTRGVYTIDRAPTGPDRKSTRLNSSHSQISY